tara:strand:+ start:254 stop:517 length:264 start_codon:yes stop_codon:yes gene_type:complete
MNSTIYGTVHVKESISRLNLICKTVASELVTVKENALSVEHLQDAMIPPPRLSPADVFETNVIYLPSFESIVVDPSLTRFNTAFVCD